MNDRVYPSGKPAPAPAHAPASATNPSFPATKAQLYNASRPVYRPQTSRSRRGRCCSCCLCTTLVIAILILLAAIAAAVLWVIYRPQRPKFTVSKLQISQFNLSSNSHLATNLSLALIARNPNKKLVFLYNPIDVSVSADGVPAGSGSFPAFTLPTKNTTILKTQITSGSRIGGSDATSLRSDVKSKKSFPLKIELNTKVRVKIGGIKTNRVRVRVACGGIKASAPAGKTPATAATSGAKCKVDLRVKIWKWTF